MLSNIYPIRLLIVSLVVVLPFRSVFAEESDRKIYIFTSDCVTKIETKKHPHTLNWELLINLNDTTAEDLFSFSKLHTRKLVSTIDGNGNKLGYDSLIIEPISSPFHISGLETEEEAKSIKYLILNSRGNCGEKKN